MFRFKKKDEYKVKYINTNAENAHGKKRRRFNKKVKDNILKCIEKRKDNLYSDYDVLLECKKCDFNGRCKNFRKSFGIKKFKFNKHKPMGV